MKILFCPCHYVFDESDRGSELSWAFKIADGIARLLPDSLVVTGFKNIKSKVPYRITELQKEKKSVDLGILNTIKFNFLYSRYMNMLIVKESFDVIHHVLPFGIDRTFNVALIFRRKKKAPSVIGPIQNSLPSFSDNVEDIHGIRKSFFRFWTNILLFKILHPLLCYLSLLTLLKADKIIVINISTKNLLLKRKIKAEKIVIIPPGVDCKRFTPLEKENKENKVFEILAASTLMERKDVASIIKGIFEVHKTNKNIRLRILGDGPQMNELRELTKSLSLERIVIFEGHVPHSEMVRYYQNAQIFVAMSKAEGFATVCLEAMASGLAIVSTKVGGFTDAITDGVNGYLVEKGDYQVLAERITSLLNNRRLISQFGMKARKDAEEKYDWNYVIIPAYLDLYSKLLI